jgi:hypothetical protein
VKSVGNDVGRHRLVRKARNLIYRVSWAQGNGKLQAYQAV